MEPRGQRARMGRPVWPVCKEARERRGSVDLSGPREYLERSGNKGQSDRQRST